MAETRIIAPGKTKGTFARSGPQPVDLSFRTTSRVITHENKTGVRLLTPALYGDEGDRTPDPDTASVVLSQLSYIPSRAAIIAVKAAEGQANRPPAA